MKSHLLLLLLLPLSVFAQKTRFDVNKFKTNLIKNDSIKVFNFRKLNANNVNENVFDIGNVSSKYVVSKKTGQRYVELMKKMNINLNPGNPRVEGNYLGCCACCVETTVKTFSPVGVYTFTPNNNGSSTASITLSVYANVQYLVRITGSTNQARNFTVNFGSTNNSQSFGVQANNFEITFIAKPQKTGNFFFSLYSSEPGLWSFYNCAVTEL